MAASISFTIFNACCFASRTEIFFHVNLAQRFPQVFVYIFRAALPARLQLLLASQSLSIESEILVQQC